MGREAKIVTKHLCKALFFFVLALFLPFTGCGKKGPLKPPPDITLERVEKSDKRPDLPPPANLSFQILENKGAVLLSYEGKGCSAFKIYRYTKGRKRTTPYAVTEKNSFLDELPLLGIPMIYEVTCVSNGNESEKSIAIEVTFK